jgi:hypothetical protein
MDTRRHLGDTAEETVSTKIKPPRRVVDPASTALLELYKLLLASEKFLAWRPAKYDAEYCLGSQRTPSRRGEFGPEDLETNQNAAERHYTPQELAQLWAVSIQTIREVFKNEEGVLKIGSDGTRTRRGYKTLRIPESVAERVHTRLSA